MTTHLTRVRTLLTGARTGPGIRSLLAGAALLFCAAAPTTYATLAEADSSAPERGAPYIETRLFFGTARPDGAAAVTDRQFMAFVDKEVTPGFPNGLTVQSGRGQWRDASEKIEKESGVDERARVDF